VATYVKFQGSTGTSYRVLFDLPYENGTRRQMQKAGFKTEKEAREWYEDYMYKFRRSGIQLTSKQLKFAHYVEEWERLSANQWTPKTHEGYASILRAHLLPAFGKKDLKKFSVLDVERYIANKVGSGLNPNSVKHHVVLLKTILNSAVRQGIILHNPVEQAKLPKVARYIPQTYVPEEISRFLKELQGTQYYAITYVAFWTGARRGELLALKWSDVNLQRKLITIMKSKTVVTKRYEEGKVKGQTKTDPSVRVIAISDDLWRRNYSTGWRLTM